MSIDDKLREILDNLVQQATDDTPYNWIDEILESIAQIKQAFQDEGYRWVPKQAEIQSLVDKGLAEYVVTVPSGEWHHDYKASKRMTGQEWYDRFARSLRINFGGDQDTMVALYLVKDAAKQAAGLDK